MSKVWDSELWLLVGLISLVLFFTIVLAGCEDAPIPEMRYLGPPIVNPIITTRGYPARLDAWSLDGAKWPVYAAFGYTVRFNWLESGDQFTEPGIHVAVTTGDVWAPLWSPVLDGKFITGSGNDDEGDPDAITAVGEDDGVVRLFCGMRNWPHQTPFDNRIGVRWHVCGYDEHDFYSSCMFTQGSASFFQRYGGLELSAQSWPTHVNCSLGEPLKTGAETEPNEMPLGLNSAPPLPKVLVDDIPPVLAECVLSVDYPPYSDPNAGGEGILIRSRWMKARVSGGEWGISPALFITPLPYGDGDATSIADAAWPYTVSFHAPAQSARLGTIDATLSIVGPAGGSLTAIDIQVHEVGPCTNCDGWVWRSDYVLPLTTQTTGRLEATTGPVPVVIVRLPRGHNMRISGIKSPRNIFIVTQHWLARDSILDLNRDGVVNFGDYGILLGMR